MAQSTMILTPVPLASVPTPPAGKYGFFLSDGTGGLTANALYKIDSARTTTAMIPAAFTTEDAQDAVGNILVDSTSIDFTYDDATPFISAVVVTEAIQDIVGALISAANGTISVVYTDGANTLTIGVGSITASLVSDFNEAAQDAIGTILVDTAEIDLTYADGTPSITADLKANSVALARLAQGTDGSIVGVAVGSGTSNLVLLTDDQLARILNNGIVTRSLTTAPAIVSQTGEQVIATWAVPTSVHTAGDTYLLQLFALLINAASINQVTAKVKAGATGSGTGATQVAVTAKSTPATARATPGQLIYISSLLTIKSIGAGGTIQGGVNLDGLTFEGGALPAAIPAQSAAAVAFDTTAARDIVITLTQGVANAGTILAASITKV